MANLEEGFELSIFELGEELFLNARSYRVFLTLDKRPSSKLVEPRVEGRFRPITSPL